jgi:hypothetical protein
LSAEENIQGEKKIPLIPMIKFEYASLIVIFIFFVFLSIVQSI